MAALEICQSEPALNGDMERLAKHLAQAQGQLFPAEELAPNTPEVREMARGAMDNLVQSLRVLQDADGGKALDGAMDAVTLAIKALHPVIQGTQPEPQRQPSESPAEVRVSTAINLHTDHYFYNGFSDDITDGGIFIATFDPKSVDELVVVNFKLPDGHRVTTRGVVQFIKEYNAMTPDTAPGMGVKFMELRQKDKLAIERFLKKRGPVFYDDGQ